PRSRSASGTRPRTRTTRWRRPARPATWYRRSCRPRCPNNRPRRPGRNAEGPASRGLRALPAGAGSGADRRHRPGDVFQVALVERGHADAAGAHRIDAVLVAQAVDLGLAQARVREHARLLGDEAELRPAQLG